MFFILDLFAALSSSNDAEALNKRTEERKHTNEKHIKAELILNASEQILMLTDLRGPDYD